MPPPLLPELKTGWAPIFFASFGWRVGRFFGAKNKPEMFRGSKCLYIVGGIDGRFLSSLCHVNTANILTKYTFGRNPLPRRFPIATRSKDHIPPWSKRKLEAMTLYNETASNETGEQYLFLQTFIFEKYVSFFHFGRWETYHHRGRKKDIFFGFAIIIC